LNYLHDHAESEFNDSCGLHINLNDYLREKSGAGAVSMEIPTRRFDPLWRLVAPSRRENTYCNRQAFSRSQKYSMIFAQADRWEFRFFSPTLDAVKMNHYVQLANVMYRRLNGQPAQLSVATMEYFVAKMKADPRKFTDEQIHDTLVFVNTLRPLVEMDEKFRVGGTYMSSELDEAIVERTFVDKDRFAWPVFDGMPSIQFLLTNPMVRTSPLYF
jgi:hypothetical protein